ncbi:MAG: S8 family peptidase [Caldilineaceae bacterium]|nr:S8 family peptidase [Caldilineaceae bacterium]
MAEQTTKRFIVTFADPATKRTEAAGVLNVSPRTIKDGVGALATDDVHANEQLLHFDEIGVTIANLSNENAEELRHDDRVLEVVEDFDVFALHELGGMETYADAESDLPDDTTADEVYQAFWAGYQQALMQQYSYGIDGGRVASPLLPYPLPYPVKPTARQPLPWAPAPVRPVLRQPIPWNMSLVNAPAAWRYATGRGVKVAILDTGIDTNHPDLAVAGGVSFVPGVSSWDDDHGHGTHCAGIAGARNNNTGVVGVAPRCSLYAVKVLNSVGAGQLSWILAGMGWAATNKMQVVSMSLGSNVSTPDATCVVAYQRAADLIAQQGGIIVAAAGNNGRDPNNPWVGQPARCPGFMAVAAVDRNRALADFSSRGPASLSELRGVEIAAPGVSVQSTWPGGGYRALSGTSMACPHVAGAAALLKELHPNWTPMQIRRHLKSTASDLGVPGNDPGFGAGLLNCQRAVAS